MRTLLAIPTLVFAVLLASATRSPAQNAGDALVLNYVSGGTDLLSVTPAGVITSVYMKSSTGTPDGMTAGPLNNGVVFVETDSSRQRRFLHVVPGSGVTTIGTLPSAVTSAPSLRLDDGGDLLVLSPSGASRGVLITPFGGGPFGTLAALSGNGFLYAMEEDVPSGDILVFDTARTIHRIRPDATVTTVRYTLPLSLSLAVIGNVHVDFATGLVLLHFGNHVLSVDPNTGATTTIVAPSTTSRSSFYGIDADPFGGGFLQAVTRVTPAAGNQLLRYVPTTSTLTTVATLPTGRPTDLVAFGSRVLTPLGRPFRGTAYPIRTAIPNEAGQTYLAGCAFGALGGISIPGGGRIPLDPDPLFFLSQSLPSVFSGFVGTLDAGGRANLVINLPGFVLLVGTRFHVAVVTYDGTGIRVISEPFGVVIE